MMRRTHKGLMYGLVPVYLDFTQRDCPGVEGRWFWCEWLLDVCNISFEAFCYVVSMVNPSFEPLFPIQITETLDWDGEEIGG